jgi:hypothetical protein
MIMAWRPSEYLIEGMLDNTTPGKVIGFMRFLGKRNKIKFDLQGDFHRDIRGAVIKFHNEQYKEADPQEAKKYCRAFVAVQTGVVGDITAGLPPHDYGQSPYAEWYSDQNGRVVVELDTEQVQVIGKPIPWQESFPVDRKQQGQNMMNFIAGLVGAKKKSK